MLEYGKIRICTILFAYITSNQCVLKTFVEKYDELDYKLYDIGNYFRTREQAEEVAKEIRAIFEKHKNE
jgi:hypothetical protein